MLIHSNVKERYCAKKGHYFRVHIKSIINDKKRENQKYYFFNQMKNPNTREDGLRAANNKAIHLCHRHDQLRKARDNRINLIHFFFNKEGKPKGISLVKIKRNGRKINFDLIVQKRINNKVYSRSKSVPVDCLLHSNAITFNMIFNEQFNYLCSVLDLDRNNFHVNFFKRLIFKILFNKFTREEILN